MNLTPENLIKLPIGKYVITRKPFITSPGFIQTNELHVWEDGEHIRYYIGKFPERFSVTINTDDETGTLFIDAVVTVADSTFRISEHSLYELKKYDIKP